VAVAASISCRACGGSAKVIACIEDPAVIRKIVKHLQAQSPVGVMGKALYSSAIVVMRRLGAIRFFSVIFLLPLKAESTCC
jgi:hypothetical protein